MTELFLSHHWGGSPGSVGWDRQEKAEDVHQCAEQRQTKPQEALSGVLGLQSAVVGGSWASSGPLAVSCCRDRQQGPCCSVLIRDFAPCLLCHSGVPAAAAAQPPCPRGEEVWGAGRPPPHAGTATPAGRGPPCSGCPLPREQGGLCLVYLFLPSLLFLSPCHSWVTICPLCPSVGCTLVSDPLTSGSPSGALPTPEPHSQAQGPRAA